jgi:hypothetical protein
LTDTLHLTLSAPAARRRGVISSGMAIAAAIVLAAVLLGAVRLLAHPADRRRCSRRWSRG